MKRYEVITHSFDSGVDQKEATHTIQEAKAIVKEYLSDSYYDSAAIYDYKHEKVVALYNGFSQEYYIAADYRNPNAKIYWIDQKEA